MMKSRFIFTLLMAIVMMAMSPQSMWAQMCSTCDGTGDCRTCYALGYIEEQCLMCEGGGCSTCNGAGTVSTDCPDCSEGYCTASNGIGHTHQWSGTCQTTDDTDDDGNHCHKYACTYEGCEAYNLEKCTLRDEYNSNTHFSICDVCGHKYNEAEHTWGDWADSQRSCTTCGASETCTEHTWGEWTSDSKRYCCTCDASETCTNHDWSEWLSDNHERHYRTCNTCYIEDYENHELTFVKHEAATCSQSGGDVYSCSICGGDVMKNQTDIDPNNHILDGIEPLEGYQHRGTCYLVHEEPLVVTENCTDADHNGACDKCEQEVPINVKFHAVYGGQEVEGGLYSSTYFQTSTNNPITFVKKGYNENDEYVVLQTLQLNDESVLEGAFRY